MSAFEKISFYVSKYGAELSLSLPYFAVLAALGLFLILRRASFFGLVMTKLAQFGFVVGFSIFSLWHEDAFDLINKSGHEQLSKELFELDLIVLPITLLCIGIALLFLIRLRGRRNNLEAAFAIIFVLLTGFIYLAHQLFGATELIVQKTYFTEILYTPREVFSHYLVHIGVVGLGFFLLYHRIFLTGFDASQAHISGMATARVEFLFFLLTGIAVAVCLRIMGLYVSMAALLVPGFLALKLFRSWRLTLLATPVLAVFLAASGFFLSFTFDQFAAETLILVNYGTWAAMLLGARAILK